MQNDNMPQFDPFNPEGPWGQFTSGYQLAPLMLGPPFAIQLFEKGGGRSLHTGIIASTQDVYNGSRADDDPVRTTLYFRGATEPLVIEWIQVAYALAEVAREVNREE